MLGDAVGLLSLLILAIASLATLAFSILGKGQNSFYSFLLAFIAIVGLMSVQNGGRNMFAFVIGASFWLGLIGFSSLIIWVVKTRYENAECLNKKLENN